jgi:hypothetical protein
MDKDIATALGRLDRYLFRVKRALRTGELAVALADTAELTEISRRLWTRLESLTQTGETRGKAKLK